MSGEYESHGEVIRSGELYFLTHPGLELFSGYGLTTYDGRKDRLVGLLMVDRPFAVDIQWLSEIEHLYGDYQLLPMAATGERGLLTQMCVASDSLPHLQPSDQPLATDLQHALQPLLETLPAPILKLKWDADKKLWLSDFWIGLPPAMQAVFEKTGYGCFAAEREDNMVAFITHAADADIEGFQYVPVQSRWEIIGMPTAPLIRFRAEILDIPTKPYVFEHFLNVADSDQARCLAKLIKQEEIIFDFYGDEYEYAYSNVLPNPVERRDDLQEILRLAIDYYGTIPPEKRDFDRAKAAFQRVYPL